MKTILSIIIALLTACTNITETLTVSETPEETPETLPASEETTIPEDAILLHIVRIEYTTCYMISSDKPGYYYTVYATDEYGTDLYCIADDLSPEDITDDIAWLINMGQYLYLTADGDLIPVYGG